MSVRSLLLKNTKISLEYKNRRNGMIEANYIRLIANIKLNMTIIKITPIH